MLQTWTHRLKEKPLPILPWSVDQLTALQRKTTAKHDDFQRVISCDPGLTIALFKAVSEKGTIPGGSIGTIAHALSLIGLGFTESMIDRLPRIPRNSGGVRKDGLSRSYSMAAHAAVYARSWAQKRNDPRPDEMAIAALLGNCGEMALWYHAKDEMKQIQLLHTKGVDTIEAEQQVLGQPISEINQGLVDAWGLPQLTREAQEPIGAFNPRSLGVMLALELVRSTHYGWHGEVIDDLIELAAQYQKQTLNETSAAIHRDAVAVAHRITGSQLPLAAEHLIRYEKNLPLAQTPLQETPTPTPSEKQQVASPLLKKPRENEVNEVVTEVTATSAPSPTAPQAPQAKQEKQPENHLQKSLSNIVTLLKEEVGLEQVMFAMLTNDRRYLKCRFAVGDPERNLAGFLVGLDKKHLITALMAKQQSFWLNPENRQKYLPAIPKEVLSVINGKGFFVSSLYLKNRPLGILYGSCPEGDALQKPQFEQFRQLSQRLCNSLEQRN